jgi:uncharacterized protein YbjQ (UPF0145 family)
MAMIECVRCNTDIAPEASQEIDGLRYCAECAVSARQALTAKKAEVLKEKRKIVRDRNAIEQEMRTITAEDTQHIVLSTTDTIETGRIVEYIDVISVQDVIFQSIHVDPVQAESQEELAEKIFRNRIELTMSKLKKRAYLVGADAVVGIHIDSSMDNKPESEYTIAVGIKLSVTGTAVRLISDL